MSSLSDQAARLHGVREGAAPGGRVRVGVLALQGDVREHVEALSAVGAEAVPVRRASELASVSGLIIPGGESTAIAHLLRVFGLMEPLRSAIAGGLPVLGTCAGMILLADTIADPAVVRGAEQESVGGLDVTVRRNAFGRQVDSFESDLTLAAWGEALPEASTVRAVFIRAPRIEAVGEGVSVLASVDAHPVAVAQGNLVATAFHPESAGETALHAWLVAAAAAHAAA